MCDDCGSRQESAIMIKREKGQRQLTWLCGGPVCFFVFLKICLFASQSCRKRGRGLPSTASLSKWPQQQPVLSQVKNRSQELHMDHPQGCQGSKHLDYFQQLFPGSQIRSGEARTQAPLWHASIRGMRFYLLYHNASPRACVS